MFVPWRVVFLERVTFQGTMLKLGTISHSIHVLMTCQVACANHEWMKAPPFTGSSVAQAQGVLGR